MHLYHLTLSICKLHIYNEENKGVCIQKKTKRYIYIQNNNCISPCSGTVQKFFSEHRKPLTFLSTSNFHHSVHDVLNFKLFLTKKKKKKKLNTIKTRNIYLPQTLPKRTFKRNFLLITLENFRMVYSYHIMPGINNNLW